MNDQLKTILQTVAPLLASALGSPLAGGVVSILSNVLLGKPMANTSDILKALSSATPDTWLKLKEAENQFNIDIQKIGLDKQKLEEASIENARLKEIEMNKNGRRDFTNPILCFVFTVAFFVVIILMFFFHIQPDMKEVANTLIGSIVTIESVIMNYYFGSSAGSRNKDDIIALNANTINRQK